MSELENKGIALTDNHRRQLYIEDFRKMKSQILEISLIDYGTGTKLMEQYTGLARKIDSSGELSKDTLNELETLKQSVEEHKSQELDEKNIAVVTIRGKCDYLMSILNADSIEEVESRMERAKRVSRKP